MNVDQIVVFCDSVLGEAVFGRLGGAGIHLLRVQCIFKEERHRTSNVGERSEISAVL